MVLVHIYSNPKLDSIAICEQEILERGFSESREVFLSKCEVLDVAVLFIITNECIQLSFIKQSRYTTPEHLCVFKKYRF